MKRPGPKKGGARAARYAALSRGKKGKRRAPAAAHQEPQGPIPPPPASIPRLPLSPPSESPSPRPSPRGRSRSLIDTHHVLADLRNIGLTTGFMLLLMFALYLLIPR